MGLSKFAARARSCHPVVALLACLAATSATRTAVAEDRPSLDTRTWRPSTDPNASLVIEPAVTPGPGVFTIGAYGHYSFHPVSLRDPTNDDVKLRPLAHSLGLDAIANIGIGQRLSLGAALPFLAYQDGSGGLPKTVMTDSRVPKTAFGDLGLSVKGALIRNEQGGFGLAALGYLTLPTGNGSSFASESGPTMTARLLAEYTLLVAVAQVSVGYKLRTEHRTWPDASAGGVRFGDEIPWTFGLAVRPGFLGIDPGNRQRLEVGLHGWLPAGPVGPFGTGRPGSAALSPMQLALSDRIELGHYRDVFLTVGGEIGLTHAVGVPAFSGIVGIGFTPRAHDMDGDGVKDDVDGCPEIPEDKDGFEDSDGCPEIDNDEDGVIDKEDACPNVKGSPSRNPAKNGCPGNDEDRDGIDDLHDACPHDRGPISKNPDLNGCPAKDSDGDGIVDQVDKCPNQPEDKDGWEDDDGCPDPDNDGDGIPDKEDACPGTKGDRSNDPARSGCPNADRDGDTFPNDQDKCPDAAEVFNGVTDDDGCPDEGGKPLLTIDANRTVRLAAPIKLTKPTPGTAPDVDPSSLPVLRALAYELNRHPEWTLAVGARPTAGENGQLESLAKSFTIVRALSNFSNRDGIAETVSWDGVKTQPQAESGFAFRILVLPSAAPQPVAIPPLPAPKP